MTRTDWSPDWSPGHWCRVKATKVISRSASKVNLKSFVHVNNELMTIIGDVGQLVTVGGWVGGGGVLVRGSVKLDPPTQWSREDTWTQGQIWASPERTLRVHNT